jgi:hypothetical protein
VFAGEGFGECHCGAASFFTWLKTGPGHKAICAASCCRRVWPGCGSTASATRSPVADLLGADDISASSHALTLPAQRAILAAVVDVTVMPGRRGPQFDAASIVLDYKA